MPAGTVNKIVLEVRPLDHPIQSLCRIRFNRSQPGSIMSAPVIILGATGGVGTALARRFAAEGTPLHLIARRPKPLAELAAELGASHAVADVEDAAAVAAAVRAGDTGAGFAGLVYAVGSIVLKPLKASSVADFMQAYQTNLIGAAMALQAAEKGLKAARGRVVLFSSIAAAQGFTGHSVIASAKGAVEALARSLAAEWAPLVCVNVVAPSLTRTRMATALTSNETMAQGIAALHPINRLGEAEDIAAAAAFLLSPAAGWITGQVLGVDGGRSTLRTKG
jgi:NAD(P)-dependent dehydrogenase (short-subunit alcohol dehydrogenase family)